MADLVLIGAAGMAALLLLGSRRKKAVLRRADPSPPITTDKPEDPDGSDEPKGPAEGRIERIEELLEEHLSDVPRDGFLYQVIKGETLEDLARAVLGRLGKYTEQMLLDYIHCISSGSYNLGRYGTPSTTKTFPRKYLAPGIQKGLRVAFMPRNQDALEAFRSGRLPRMTVDPRTGAPLDKNATSYGLIWFPPIEPTDFDAGIVTCAPFQWEDGSSTIDPDPELLALVT